MFQCTFAATCATIVSGAIAERCSFNGYIIFSSVVTGIIYPLVVHWCWSGDGWLGQRGYKGGHFLASSFLEALDKPLLFFADFAGSGVVHLSGGIHALVGKKDSQIGWQGGR